MKGDYSKAKEITLKTKEIVLKRQNYNSISGVSLTGKEIEFHHVVPRGVGGVGYAFNIVAITKQEHRELTDHLDITINGKPYLTYKEFDTLCKNHLKLNYTNWSEKGCKYHKGWIEEDYGIRLENECLKKI